MAEGGWNSKGRARTNVNKTASIRLHRSIHRSVVARLPVDTYSANEFIDVAPYGQDDWRN